MRDFFKTAAASAVGTLVGLLTVVFLLGIGAFGLLGVLLASGNAEPEIEIEDKSVLVFDLGTDIVDGAVPPVGPIFADAFGAVPSVSLHSALEAIAAAAEDDKISGIYLKGSSAEGLATLKEVREALSAFKESGKPIWAYSTSFGERDYYMTSVADNLVLAPVGAMEINGFSAQTQFLANALEKYGVGVQAVRAGRYKSAVETFTRSAYSPESEQQTEAIIGDLWQDFTQTVSSDRDFTPEQVQTLADTVALVEAEQALEIGLVDRLGFYSEVLAELKTLTGTEEDEGFEPEGGVSSGLSAGVTEADDFPQTSLTTYAQVVSRKARRGRQPDDTVAVVYGEGNIIVGDDNFVPGSITSKGFSATLRAMRKDEDVKAVVLRVNSPGGSALASEVIANEVQQLAETKPVIVSMGDYAASGGYMIAAPGGKIIASPNTITGSIGVYSLLLNFQEIANKNGVTWDTVKTANFADMQTTSRPQTEAELSIQQSYTDSLYDRFMSIVAEGRDISKERVNQVAQGRVWSGEDAIAANLVDELGGLNDAIALAAETAEIEDFKVREFPRLPTFEEQLLNSFFGAGLIDVAAKLPWNKDPLMETLLTLREELTLLDTLNDPNSAYMRLPFSTEIE